MPAGWQTLVAITTAAYAQLLLGQATAGVLPAQTPEYLEQRAQKIWRWQEVGRGGWLTFWLLFGHCSVADLWLWYGQ